MRYGQQEEQRRIAVHGRAAHLAIVAGKADAPDSGGRSSRAHVDSSLRRSELAVALRRAFPFVQDG